MIPFGEWLPDQAPLNSSGATVATNVIAAARGYRPFLGLATLSQASDAYLRGFFATIDSGGTVHLFAGIIVLMVLIYNTSKNKYQINKLGFNLGVAFWHFLDILWLYLFLFFYFFG